MMIMLMRVLELSGGLGLERGSQSDPAERQSDLRENLKYKDSEGLPRPQGPVHSQWKDERSQTGVQTYEGHLPQRPVLQGYQTRDREEGKIS